MRKNKALTLNNQQGSDIDIIKSENAIEKIYDKYAHQQLLKKHEFLI